MIENRIKYIEDTHGNEFNVCEEMFTTIDNNLKHFEEEHENKCHV